MSDKDILTLISRLGSNAYDATDLGNGHAQIEVTASQAGKLQEILGKDHTAFVGFDGSHVIIQVSLEKLKDAAETNQRVKNGQSIEVNIVSRMTYAIDAPEATNDIKKAWWEAETKTGAIKVNGKEYPIVMGFAGNYYDAPKDEEAAKDWNPERIVYVVELPTAEGLLTLTSYGITNLIRRVCGRSETIG